MKSQNIMTFHDLFVSTNCAFNFCLNKLADICEKKIEYQLVIFFCFKISAKIINFLYKTPIFTESCWSKHVFI